MEWERGGAIPLLHHFIAAGQCSLGKKRLPREGFTADVVQGIIKNTILNPNVTLLLYLLVRCTRRGQDLSFHHATAVDQLKVCLYFGLARWVNGILNRGALDNWVGDRWDWKKEIVVVTGGSDGFGKVLVHLFAAKNIKVINLDVQHPTYEAPNTNVHYHQCDLSSPESIATTCATVRNTYGPPTILINNAGISNRHNLLTTSDDRLTRLFAVNTLAHFRLLREFLPTIAAANHGMIVTVASLAGYVTCPGLVDYCATKAAVISLHEGLTEELRVRYNAPKVRTVCVCPNFARTKLAEGFVNRSHFMSPTLEPETVAEAIFEKVMSGRSGHVVLPKTHDWLALGLRAMPWWFQTAIRRGLKETMRATEAEQGERDALEKETKKSGGRLEEEEISTAVA